MKDVRDLCSGTRRLPRHGGEPPERPDAEALQKPGGSV